MCLDKLNSVKKSLKKDNVEDKWTKFRMTLNRYGYNRSEFIILDRQEMTFDMINEHLVIRVVAPHPQFPGKTRVKSIPSIPDRFIPGDVYVMWSYEKRQDVDGPSILPDNRTRPFCNNLLDVDKLYTRSSIDAMDNQMGLPVFEAGGGYWNDNGTIKAHCRHIWVQNLVKKK